MRILIVSLAALAAACAAPAKTGPATDAALAVSTAAPAPPPAAAAPRSFLAAIQEHCGQAFEGRIVANEPSSPADAFANQRLVMHVRDCRDGEVRIPFHVGGDHSRTWILTQLPDGRLRLKHDHRHEDGSPDRVSMYGGETVARGSRERQEFPADAFTRDLFQREGLAVSIPNVWAIEVREGQSFTYELRRPGRLFRVHFDLTRPVQPPPPPPWGAQP